MYEDDPELYDLWQRWESANSRYEAAVRRVEQFTAAALAPYAEPPSFNVEEMMEASEARDQAEREFREIDEEYQRRSDDYWQRKTGGSR